MAAPHAPVLVGIGVATQREDDPARAAEPLDLMITAARRAGTDALDDPRALLAGIGRVAVPKGRWRYRNPGGAIARDLGAERAVSVLASVGVLQQTLIGDACRAIADGEIDTALVVGGDAGHRILRATIAGSRAHERQQDDAPDVTLSPADDLCHPVELRAGLGRAVGLYAMMETAWRARHGVSVDAHRDRLAAMYSRFSEIAAENPHAWQRGPLDAASIRDASSQNPMQAFPYTRRHCATWNVDQAGALLFCSTARADELGIPHAKRIHPRASAESNHMVHVSARADLAACTGAGIAGHAALDAAELSIADVDLVELYSCFPVAVETYAEALGLSLERDLTVTGSMAFAGGPFNNYVIQATCRMAELLRAGAGRHGLVTSVSGVLTKQGFGVWSREAAPAGFASRDVSDAVARRQDLRHVVDSAAGSATIAAYTVLHERDQAPRGVAIVDVGDARTVGDTVDAAIVARMQSTEMCGVPVSLGADHSFTLFV